MLMDYCDSNVLDGKIEGVANAILAFSSVNARDYANDLALWLSSERMENGGWLASSYLGWYEYPKINSQAVRALASTIGTNLTMGRVPLFGE